MPTAIDSMVTLAESLAANGKEVKVTVLKRRGPRKGETMQRNAQHGAGRAMGSIGSDDSNGSGASHAVGGGKGQTITRVTGLGKEMVKDLDSVKRRYASDAKRLRREAVLNG